MLGWMLRLLRETCVCLQETGAVPPVFLEALCLKSGEVCDSVEGGRELHQSNALCYPNVQANPANSHETAHCS